MSDFMDVVHKQRSRARKERHDVDGLVVFVTPSGWQHFLASDDANHYVRRAEEGRPVGFLALHDVLGVSLPEELNEYGEAASLTVFGMPVYARARTLHGTADVVCMWTGLSSTDNPVPPYHPTQRLRAYTKTGWCSRTPVVVRHDEEAYFGLRTFAMPVDPDPAAPADRVLWRCGWGR